MNSHNANVSINGDEMSTGHAVCVVAGRKRDQELETRGEED